MKIKHLALSLVAALAMGTSAFAGSYSDTMYISYTTDSVYNSCSIYTPSYYFYNSNIPSYLEVEVYCNYSGSSIAITADAGYYYDGSWRNLADGYGNYISYGIYSPAGGELGDSGYTSTYGYGGPYYTTSTGGYQYIDFPFQLIDSYSVAGTYSDAVTFTVNY